VGYLVEEEITQKVIGAAIEVHRQLGPGLLESAYEVCLAHELQQRGVRFGRQIPVPINYKGLEVACGYRADLIVEETVVVELKAVDKLLPVHDAQLLTYLKLTGLRVGLILNFNVYSLKKGIVRRVL